MIEHNRNKNKSFRLSLDAFILCPVIIEKKRHQIIIIHVMIFKRSIGLICLYDMDNSCMF